MKTFKIIISSLVGFLVIFLLFVMYAPFSFSISNNKSDFSEVMKTADLAEETPVTNIHMLGAHDAFSHKIGLFSPSDPSEDGLVNNPYAKAFFKGGMVRVARAQKHSAERLLKSGVRYFDVRISYHKDTWYTKHGFISDKLEVYLQEIYVFLNDHPSEFIIFDVQHIYTSDQTVSDFVNYLLTNELEDNTFDHYIHYDSETTSLENLKYKDVHSETKGGIIFLINDDSSLTNDNKKLIYNRGNGEDEAISIRSKWHNKYDLDEIALDIDNEANFISEGDYQKMFRLNQAQLTPNYLKAPFKTIFSWSLLDLARKSNSALLGHANFDHWLEAMPIFMVDFANTSYQDFSANINDKILTANMNLPG